MLLCVTLKSVNSAATIVGIDYRKRPFVSRPSKVARAFYYFRRTLFANIGAANVTRRFHFRRGAVDQPRKDNALIPFERARTFIHTYIQTHIHTHTFPHAIKQFRAFLSRKHFHSREVGAIYKTITPPYAV